MLNWIEIWGICEPRQHLKLTVVLFNPFVNHLHSVAVRIILLQEATTIREHHERVYTVCNNAEEGATCQSNITWKAEPKVSQQYTASANLSSFHSAS